MSKKLTTHRRPWTKQGISELRKLVDENTPIKVISIKLKRTVGAIYSMANKVHIRLR